jgi:hypothetical protein
MSEEKEVKGKGKIGGAWAEFLVETAIAFPHWALAKMQSTAEPYPLVVKAIPVLIIMLSIASVATIDSRVMVHHDGWNSPLIAAGAALMVPVATLAAAMIRYRAWAALFWGVSFLFAALSGAIQYGVYSSPNMDAMMTLEAVAFGFGIPTAEVLMAIMEAIAIRQFHEDKQKKADDEAAAAKAAADKIEHDAKIAEQKAAMAEAAAKAAERAAQLQAEEDEARRLENEIRMAQLQAESDARIAAIKEAATFEDERKRIELAEKVKDRDAARQAKLIKVQIKAEKSTGSKVEKSWNGAEKDPGKQVGKAQGRRIDEREIIAKMIPVYQSNPGISNRKAGEAVGVSHTTIAKLIEIGKVNEVFHVIDGEDGREIHVNGGAANYLKGMEL